MPDQRITELGVILGNQLSDNDPFVTVDISDTTMTPDGTNKQLRLGQLKENLRITGFLEDAPSDGNQYVRLNGAWTTITVPASGIPEAPDDGNDYIRKNQAWQIADYFSGAWGDLSGVPSTFPPESHNHVEADIIDLGSYIEDAPLNGSTYGRQNGSWVVVNIPTPGIPDAPVDGQDYIRRDAQWFAANYFSGVFGDLSNIPATFPPSGHTHVIADITDFTDNSANWNEAYSWGDHALAGYLTAETDSQTLTWDGATGELSILNGNTVDLDGRYLQSFTETDPTVPAAVKAITVGDIANWDDAFSWGDHSLAGYIEGVGVGDGLDLTGSVAVPVINLRLETLPSIPTSMGGTDQLIVLRTNTEYREAAQNIDISIFNNDAGYFTEINAGTGLTISGTVTVPVVELNFAALPIPIDIDQFDSIVTVREGANTRVPIGDIPLSIFNNDAGYTSNIGTITFVNAGPGLSGGGGSGPVTLSLPTTITAGTYGSVSDTQKIDTITVNDHGQVTSITTGPTGDITSIVAGTGLTGGGSSGAVTLDLSAHNHTASEIIDFTTAVNNLVSGSYVSITGDTMTGSLTIDEGAGTSTLSIGDSNDSSAAINFYKSDGANMQFKWDGNYLQQRRSGAGTVDGWVFDSFSTRALKLTNSGEMTLRQDLIMESRGGGRIQIAGNSTGNANTCWVGFYESNGSTRQGYVGFPTSTNNDLYLNCDVGAIRLTPNAGEVLITDSGDLQVSRDGTAVLEMLALNATGGIVGTDTNHDLVLRRNNITKLTIGSSMATFVDDVTSTNFRLSSDRRHKKNISDLKASSVPIRWRVFTMGGKTRTGVIAQEIEQINPHWVHTNKDGYKSVSYIDMLCAKVAELEARIENLISHGGS